MWERLLNPSDLSAMALEEVAQLMETASKKNNSLGVERFLMDPNVKLNELPSMLANMNKEKLISTGASSDKMDVACKKVITDEKLNELWKEVD